MFSYSYDYQTTGLHYVLGFMPYFTKYLKNTPTVFCFVSCFLSAGDQTHGLLHAREAPYP